jgi:isopentenyl diphosphate isomerase/L-lactate dehydrogenase-like FMN-dependent dehydrogenase
MMPDGSTLISLADFERVAQEVLEPGALAYYAGGANDEVTMRDNVAAWQRIPIVPRVLVGAERRDPSVTFLGRRRPHPLILAPTASQRLAHADGERAAAQAAAATGAVVTISTYASTTLPEVAQAAPDATRWFQLYVFRDRGISRELIAQAVAHGYEALVITVDLPVIGVRERELRWPVQTEVTAPMAESWLAGAGGDSPTPSEITSGTDAGLTWADIEAFAAESTIPVIVKGILAPEDAVLAAEHGARAVVVSNHGGRQLDTVLASADALGPVVEAAGDRVDVLVDGGIRRGTDVFKALALGARGVLVGRPILWGLAAGGRAGVTQVLEILLAEFDTALALSGALRADAVDLRFIASRHRVGPGS